MNSKNTFMPVNVVQQLQAAYDKIAELERKLDISERAYEHVAEMRLIMHKQLKDLQNPKVIDYNKKAIEIVEKIMEERKKGKDADLFRVHILCAMLDYMLNEQLIFAGDAMGLHPAWMILMDIFSDYTSSDAFGCLSGDLIDYMIFD